FDVRGMVQLKHKDLRTNLPSGVRNIRIAQTCNALHFLHSSLRTPGNGATIATYVVTYDDNSTETVKAVVGHDIGHIYSSEATQPPPPPVIAWRGQTAYTKWRGDKDSKTIMACLYEMTWTNPHPEKPVKSLDFVSADTEHAAPVLFAITAE
ncbi:MAG: hypothetical protein ABI318_23050, partial [Chthoniobacteraceae bacterium]